MNTDAPWPGPDEAWWRVQKIQTKLHQWAIDGPWPEQDEVRLLDLATVAIVRYRYRGAAIPSPWATTQDAA